MAMLEVELVPEDKILRFHFATVRTSEYEVTPVMDQTGLQSEGRKIRFSIVAIVNAVTVSTNKPNPNIVSADNRGDDLGVSMRNIADLLMRPRQPITYTVGDRFVLSLPRFRKADVRFRSDVFGGPFPKRASFTQITGDKSAILVFDVECFDSEVDNILVSNMWSLTSQIDSTGMTTRTISGHANFRLDMLKSESLVADDFRNVLIPPAGDKMRRIGVRVDVNANGHELDFVVTDRETMYGTGEMGDCVEVTGTVTSSVIYPLKDFKDIGGAAGGALKDLMSFDFGGLFKRIWDANVPSNHNVGVCRVVGKKNANRNQLTLIAIGCILDRFSPIIGPGGLAAKRAAVVAAHTTNSFDSEHSPFSEVKLEIMNFSIKGIQKIFSREPEKLINPSRDIEVGGGINFTDNTERATLPASNNSRGSWLGRLITQALTPPGFDLPGDVPDNAAARNVPNIM